VKPVLNDRRASFPVFFFFIRNSGHPANNTDSPHRNTIVYTDPVQRPQSKLIIYKPYLITGFVGVSVLPGWWQSAGPTQAEWQTVFYRKRRKTARPRRPCSTSATTTWVEDGRPNPEKNGLRPIRHSLLASIWTEKKGDQKRVSIRDAFTTCATSINMPLEWVF
jgi:hypothetical protein